MRVFRFNKNLTIASVIIVLAVIIISAILLTPRKISECSIDIDGDGINDSLSIEKQGIGRFGDSLVIETQSQRQIYDFKDWKPWKVQAADVDGDEDVEISVGVYKTTRFDPEYKKRPFIYNWDEDGISPKWLGSRLSRTFEDYIFADVNGDGMDDIVSIEILPEGGYIINSYRWKGFGFIGLGQSAEFEDVSRIEAGELIDGNKRPINARVRISGKWQWVALVYNNEQLILED